MNDDIRERAIVATLKSYLAVLPGLGIHPSRAVLFGSFVRNKADEYSDIDVVVIAPEFDGMREIALIEKLWQARIFVDNRIEPILCGEKEWETEQGRPILEIARREGVVIAA
jgi:predicted nucleotidyltransferase